MLLVQSACLQKIPKTKSKPGDNVALTRYPQRAATPYYRAAVLVDTGGVPAACSVHFKWVIAS